MRRIPILFAAVLTASVLSAAPALADAIDGTWCQADGRIMEIRGPAITPQSVPAKQGATIGCEDNKRITPQFSFPEFIQQQWDLSIQS